MVGGSGFRGLYSTEIQGKESLNDIVLCIINVEIECFTVSSR